MASEGVLITFEAAKSVSLGVLYSQNSLSSSNGLSLSTLVLNIFMV